MIVNEIQEYYTLLFQINLLVVYWKFLILKTKHIFLKTFNSEYDKIKVWFTDQNRQPLEMEDKISLVK